MTFEVQRVSTSLREPPNVNTTVTGLRHLGNALVSVNNQIKSGGMDTDNINAKLTIGSNDTVGELQIDGRVKLLQFSKSRILNATVHISHI